MQHIISSRPLPPKGFRYPSGINAKAPADLNLPSQRSIPHPGACIGTPAFVAGCNQAKPRLAPCDILRKSEPDYKLGWNSFPENPSVFVQVASRQVYSDAEATLRKKIRAMKAAEPQPVGSTERWIVRHGADCSCGGLGGSMVSRRYRSICECRRSYGNSSTCHPIV